MGEVRSAKGAMVNFDLLKIKQQIASAPKNVTVEARENFIDQKFKRQIKRQTQQAMDLANEEVIDITTPSAKIITDPIIEEEDEDPSNP